MAKGRDDAWTGEFAKNVLEKHNSVESVEVLGPKLLRIHRKQHRTVVVATMAAGRVDGDVYEAAVNGAHPSPDYIVNIPAESVILGDAIRMAQEQSVGVGQLKDLMGALAVPDVSQYLVSDLRFVERNLRQHDRVAGIERLADRQYLIKRHHLPSVRVVFLHEYDLAVDHVRTAKDRYGSFDVIVITNPNGRATSDADSLAATFGSRIYTWKAFYGVLNSARM